MCPSTIIIQSISDGISLVVSFKVRPISLNFSLPDSCKSAEAESNNSSDSKINLSPTILMSFLSPKIDCNFPKNSDLYFWSSNTFDVRALFNFSPSTSISKSLIKPDFH